jgi:uncharacterized protein involved in exopolysaccharide biosynthesis
MSSATPSANLRATLAVVRRYRWLILTVFCVLIVPAVLVISQIPRTYQASANVLIVNGNTRNDPTLSSADLPSIVGSTVLLERVQRRLGISTPLLDMKKHLVAKPPAYRSGIMRIQYTDSDRDRAAMVANGIADELASYYSELSTTRYDEDLRALDKELSIQKQRLQAIDAQLQEQGGGDNLASDDASVDGDSSGQAAALESQRSLASADLQGDIAHAQATSIGARRDVLTNDQLYQQLQTSLNKATADLADARSRYTAQYPGFSALQDRVNGLKAAIAKEAARALSNAQSQSSNGDQIKAQAAVAADRAKVVALDEQLATLTGKGSVSGSAELLRLERDDVLREYQSVAARRATSLADRADALSLGSVEVVDRAIPSEAQPGIGPIRLGLTAALIIAFIAFGSAFLVDQLDPSLRRGTQIEGLYGKPLIATLRGAIGIPNDQGNNTLALPNIENDATFNTQAQVLRARVEAALGKPAVIMVTSAIAGDGKSLAAYVLAASLEKGNHRVSVMEIPNEEETSHERLSAFVDKMRSNYDFTIVDAASFGKSSSVMSLARLVDGILLAVRVGRAPGDDDESIVSVLEQFGGNIVGVVAADSDTIETFELARKDSTVFPRLQSRRSVSNDPAQALMTVAAERVQL